MTTQAITTPQGRDFVPFFRNYWRLIAPTRDQVLRSMRWIALVQLLAFVEPFMFMKVLHQVITLGPAARDTTPWLLLAMLLMIFLIGFASVAKNLRGIALAGMIEYLLPLTCGAKLLRLPLAYHHTVNSGYLIGKVIRGVTKTVELTQLLFFEIIPLAVMVIFTVALFLWFSLGAALVLVPITVFFAFLTWKIKSAMRATRVRRHEIEGESDQLLSQAIANVMTTQAFCQEKREMDAVRELKAQVLALLTEEYTAYGKSDIFRNGVIGIGRVGVITIGLWPIVGDILKAAVLAFVVTLSERIFVTCYRIGAIFDRAMDAMEPVLQMVQIMAEPEMTPDPADPVEAPARFRGRIECRDVMYTYPQRGQSDRSRPPALRGLNLVIEPGQKVGLVGTSGGGKTTLAKLPMRFYDPDQGAVLIDGIDLKRMCKAVFRRQIGYVPQTVQIYDTTVAENIAYGRPEAGSNAIVRAAQAANAHEFIVEELENGYATIVGNSGQLLSGGQCQRIGIARALLIDPPILVFDEATSNVDSMSEQKIHEAMQEICKGRTVIIIAHKLATVRDADRIFVVDHGQITDAGTHDELIARPGIYRRIASLQRLHQD